METIFLSYYSATMPTFLHLLITSSLSCSSSLTMLCTFPSFTPSSSLLFTFPFLGSSFFNLHSYMWKRLIQQGLLVQLKTTAFSFLKRNKQHFLDWTTLWSGSLSHKCLVEHIFWNCIHSHRTITKITLGKQKRMTRGNMIASSKYSNSQSSEECQETPYQRCILAQLVQRDCCFSAWRLTF